MKRQADKSRVSASKLLARVEAATGSDRELSFAIAKALVVPNYDGNSISWFGWGDHYTSSIDSALALVEQVRPGWIVSTIGQDDDKTWWVELRHGHRTSYDEVAISLKRPTPPLALLAALLKSLISASSSAVAKPERAQPPADARQASQNPPQKATT